MELNDIVTKNFESYADNTLHNQLEDVAKYHVTGGMPRDIKGRSRRTDEALLVKRY